MNLHGILAVYFVLGLASLISEFIAFYYMDEIILSNCCTPANYPNPVELGVCLAAYESSNTVLNKKDGLARIPLIFAVTIQCLTLGIVAVSWLVPISRQLRGTPFSQLVSKYTVHHGVIIFLLFAGCILFVSTAATVSSLYYSERPITAKCDSVSGKHHGQLHRVTMTFAVIQAISTCVMLILCPDIYKKVISFRHDVSKQPVLTYMQNRTTEEFSIDDGEVTEKTKVKVPSDDEEEEDVLYPHA